jgi:hypothetical protein
MAGRASFGFYRGMFISKWTLLIYVTLNTSGICASGQSGLFEFKTAMRIVAITATHGPFKNLMMEGREELRFGLAVATHAELRVAHLQHSDC